MESLLLPRGRKKFGSQAMIQVIMLADIADALSPDSWLHLRMHWVAVSLTEGALVIVSPPSMIGPGSVDVALRHLLCHVVHDDPPVKGSSCVYADALGCHQLRFPGVGGLDQGAMECAESLAQEGCIRCSCLRFVLDGAWHLPRQCPDLVDHEDRAQVRRAGVTPHLLAWDGFRLLPAVRCTLHPAVQGLVSDQRPWTHRRRG